MKVVQAKFHKTLFVYNLKLLFETHTFSSDMISILLHVAPTIPAHLLLAIVVDHCPPGKIIFFMSFLLLSICPIQGVLWGTWGIGLVACCYKQGRMLLTSM